MTYFLWPVERMMASDSPIQGHIRPRIRFQVAVVKRDHCFIQTGAFNAPESRSHDSTGCWKTDQDDKQQMFHSDGLK